MKTAFIIIYSIGLVSWTYSLVRGIQDFQTMVNSPITVYFAYGGMIFFILDQLIDMILRGE